MAAPDTLPPPLPEGDADLDAKGEDERDPKEFCVGDARAEPLQLLQEDPVGALGEGVLPKDTLVNGELLGVMEELRVFPRGGEGVPLEHQLGVKEVVGALKEGAGEAVGAS